HRLYRLICRAILEGRLAAGARLPSTRDLAAELGIARNTVLQVYDQLAEEGYVNAGVGRGTYVEDISLDLPEPAIDADKADPAAAAVCRSRARRVAPGTPAGIGPVVLRPPGGGLHARHPGRASLPPDGVVPHPEPAVALGFLRSDALCAGWGLRGAAAGDFRLS